MIEKVEDSIRKITSDIIALAREMVDTNDKERVHILATKIRALSNALNALVNLYVNASSALVCTPPPWKRHLNLA